MSQSLVYYLLAFWTLNTNGMQQPTPSLSDINNELDSLFYKVATRKYVTRPQEWPLLIKELPQYLDHPRNEVKGKILEVATLAITQAPSKHWYALNSIGRKAFARILADYEYDYNAASNYVLGLDNFLITEIDQYYLNVEDRKQSYNFAFAYYKYAALSRDFIRPRIIFKAQQQYYERTLRKKYKLEEEPDEWEHLKSSILKENDALS
jgi:hypothetical protein